MKNPPKTAERNDRQTKNPPKTAEQPYRQKKNPPKTVYTKLYSSRKSTLKAIVRFYLSGHTDTICSDPYYTFVDSASVASSVLFPNFLPSPISFLRCVLCHFLFLPIDFSGYFLTAIRGMYVLQEANMRTLTDDSHPSEASFRRRTE